MKIASFQRVRYKHNPLAEVVCQVRFDRPEGLELDYDAFRAAISGDYPKHHVDDVPTAALFQKAGISVVDRVIPDQIRISHSTSEDGSWRVSVCDEFLALTCEKYSTWDDFLPRYLSCAKEFFEGHEIVPTRVGLRYKDLIDREAIGVQDQPWSELISSFLLGPLSAHALSDDGCWDESIDHFVSQSSFQLDDCTVLLQSALLTAADSGKRAFLIDADFYLDKGINFEVSSPLLAECLRALHQNAGALFRRGITEKLHAALGPTRV